LHYDSGKAHDINVDSAYSDPRGAVDNSKTILGRRGAAAADIAADAGQVDSEITYSST